MIFTEAAVKEKWKTTATTTKMDTTKGQINIPRFPAPPTTWRLGGAGGHGRVHTGDHQTVQLRRKNNSNQLPLPPSIHVHEIVYLEGDIAIRPMFKPGGGGGCGETEAGDSLLYENPEYSHLRGHTELWLHTMGFQ